MPRAAAAERPFRDALILRLFLAGWTRRDIGRHPRVNLSKHAVDLAIHRHLELDLPHNRLLAQEARRIYVMRTEGLLRAAMSKALDPGHPEQLKAFDVCVKLLGQRARMDGLMALCDDEDDDDLVGAFPPREAPRGADGLTVLERFRTRYSDDGDHPRPS